MPKPFFTICTVLAVIVLSGCKAGKSEAWYEQPPNETYNVFSLCLKKGEASDNCELARRAAMMFAQTGESSIKENVEILFQQDAEKSPPQPRSAVSRSICLYEMAFAIR